jgi:hypothetical protein
MSVGGDGDYREQDGQDGGHNADLLAHGVVFFF